MGLFYLKFMQNSLHFKQIIRTKVVFNNFFTLILIFYGQNGKNLTLKYVEKMNSLPKLLYFIKLR